MKVQTHFQQFVSVMIEVQMSVTSFSTGCKHNFFSKECLFIMMQTHNLHVFGETPFVKPQNDTKQQLNG